MLRKKRRAAKKALGESTLDIKILKKKLEMDQQRNKNWIDISRESEVSMNDDHDSGVAKIHCYYKAKGLPRAEKEQLEKTTLLDKWKVLF